MCKMYQSYGENLEGDASNRFRTRHGHMTISYALRVELGESLCPDLIDFLTPEFGLLTNQVGLGTNFILNLILNLFANLVAQDFGLFTGVFSEHLALGPH